MGDGNVGPVAAWIISTASLATVAALFGWLASSSRDGTLERNGFVGIRTRATMRSDAAWLAGHRAAAGTVGVAAWTCGAAAVVGAALLLLGSWAGVGVVIAGYLAMFLLRIIATVRAGRAARAADS